MNTIKKLKTHIGITIAALAVLLAVAGIPSVTEAAANEKPGLSVPMYESSGRIAMYWHTKDSVQASAPDGWRVERRHRGSNGNETRTWNFNGTASDNLQTFSDDYWDWTDRTASSSQSYTYRVRTINSDSSFVNGRKWSRRAPEYCGTYGDRDPNQ